MLDQLAAAGIAGAGLVITLRSSILADASPIIWLGAIEFGIAALIATVGQIHFIEGLFCRKHNRTYTRNLTLAALVFISMGIGTLGTSVFLEGDAPKDAKANDR
jgi:hypothetical protein